MSNERKEEAGKKFDQGKARYDLIPADAEAAVVGVFTYGAEKYGDRNWEEGMSWSRPYAAALRHLKAFWNREDYDPESKKLHLAHAAVNLLFLLSFYLRGKGTDDRH